MFEAREAKSRDHNFTETFFKNIYNFLPFREKKNPSKTKYYVSGLVGNLKQFLFTREIYHPFYTLKSKLYLSALIVLFT